LAGSREKLPDREKFHKRFFEKFCWRLEDGESRVDCGNLVLRGGAGIMEVASDGTENSGDFIKQLGSEFFWFNLGLTGFK